MILRKTIEIILVLLFSKVPVRRLINGNTLKLPLPICRFYKDGEEVKFHKILELWSCAVSADVGAHIGLTTFIISQKCKKVVAFEPSPKNVKFLQQTVRMNVLDNVEIYPKAVSGASIPRKFALREGRANNGNSLTDLSGVNELIAVEATSLDELGITFDFMKIDAEGAELEILQGGRTTIGNSRRLILSLHCDILYKNKLDPKKVFYELENLGAVMIDQFGEVLESDYAGKKLPGILELYVLFPKNEPEWQQLLCSAQEILKDK